MHLLTAALSGHARYTAAAAAEEPTLEELNPQFFLLDSDDGDYATASATLLTYTPSGNLGTASYDSTLVMLYATISESELNADADLVDLRTANYPNAHCQHRWSNFENFKALGGYHQLGQSELSYERDRTGATMSGRTMLYIGYQQGPSRTADNYGDGLGFNHYNRLNGPQDPEIDKADVGEAVWNKGYSYCWCEGAHVRYGGFSAGSSPDYSHSVDVNGRMRVEDATQAAADKIYVYWDWDLMPAVTWGGYTVWEQDTNIVWEEYDSTNHIWVLGSFNTGFVGSTLGTTQVICEADVEDLTQDVETLMTRHFMKGVGTTFSDLEGDSGRSRFYVQGSGADADFDYVKVWDGSSFTDVTTAAADATTNDFEIFGVGATTGAYIAFGSTTPFSGIMANLAQVQVGGTLEAVYSQGSSSFASFNNYNDPSSGFTTGLSTHWIQFNPVIDWAQDTIDGDTAYWVLIRIASGTVTTAARGDQIRKKAGACFIHRWNDTGPTRGMCHWKTTTGLRLDLGSESSGNIEFVRPRIIGPQQEWGGGTDVTVTGGQLSLQGPWLHALANQKWKWQAGSYGTRYWAITDHLHTSASDPFLQDILAEMLAFETLAQSDMDLAAELDDMLWGEAVNYNCFDDRAEWVDIAWCGTGPYGNNIQWDLTFDGIVSRWPGASLTRANGDLIVDVDSTDNHGFAHYGNLDGSNQRYQRMAVENGKNCIDFYAQANGNRDAPVGGSSNAKKNCRFAYGYCSGKGNQDDIHTYVGFVLENDQDVGVYDNGTGVATGNTLFGWGFKGITGVANANQEQAMKVRGVLFDGTGGGQCWAISGGFSGAGLRSTNAIRFDGSSTYTDVTGSLKDQGRAFDAVYSWDGVSAFTDEVGASDDTQQIGIGTTFTLLPVSAPDGYYIAFIDASRYGMISINTDQRQVGGTGVWEYSQGSGTYATLSVTDNTTGFTNGAIDNFSTVSFTPPGDWATDTVNGATGYVVRWRKTGGTVTTLGRGNEVRGLKYEPVFPTGAAGEIFYLGTVYRVERSFTFNIVTAGVGSPTLAWEYHNGSTWTAVSNLSDGTSGFTTTGTVTFDRPAATAVDVDGNKTLLAIRCRIVSGSFSTVPILDEIGTYRSSGSLDIQYCRAKNIDVPGTGSCWGRLQTPAGTNLEGSFYIIDDNNIIELSAGESSSTLFYQQNGNASLTLAEWQAFSKLALTSDSEFDSVFGTNNTLV